MVGELITLPARVGVRATRLWFRAVEETFSLAGSATGRVVGLVASRSPGGDGARAPQEPQPQPPAPAPDAEEPASEGVGEQPMSAGEPSPRPVPDRASPPSSRGANLKPPSSSPSPATPLVEEPAHVSEEPTLVEAFAEPGAEDGAGAEVHVDPPWDGYERMNAKQIVSRLAGASSAELAAVELYEGSYRRRQTILNAVERELRSANGSASRSQKRG